MNYTYKNHLSYTIGGRLFGYRHDSIEKFCVTLSAVDKEYYRKNDYRQELRRIADLVYTDLGKELVVFLSGGTDSEIVVRNFLDIGIKPRCVTISFKDGYNALDVNESREICKELNLNLDIIDLDIIDFYKSGEAKEFGQKIQCTQVTYLMVYKSILQYGLPAVMGGEALFTKSVNRNGSFWYYTFRENEDASAMRFSEKYSIPLVNEWFSYTPEILLYYMEDKDIQSLFTDNTNYKLSSVSSKNNILSRLYPGIRKKIKTHGFERLLGFNYEAYKDIASNQIKRLENSLDGIPVNEAYDMLRGKYDS